MAQEVQIRNTRSRAKIRSPWAVALLPFVTFGMYPLVWWYRVNRELRDFGRANGEDLGQRPGSSLLAVFPGCFLVLPPLITFYRGTQRVQRAARTGGLEPVNGWIALILYFFIAPAFSAYLQLSLNSLWRSEAARIPARQPLPRGQIVTVEHQQPVAHR